MNPGVSGIVNKMKNLAIQKHSAINIHQLYSFEKTNTNSSTSEQKISARTIGKALLTNTIAYDYRHVLKFGKCPAMAWLKDEIRSLEQRKQLGEDVQPSYESKEKRDICVSLRIAYASIETGTNSCIQSELAATAAHILDYYDKDRHESECEHVYVLRKFKMNTLTEICALHEKVSELSGKLTGRAQTDQSHAIHLLKHLVIMADTYCMDREDSCESCNTVFVQIVSLRRFLGLEEFPCFIERIHEDPDELLRVINVHFSRQAWEKMNLLLQKSLKG